MSSFSKDFEATSTVSEQNVATPATSITLLDKPVFEEPQRYEEDFNDIGANWPSNPIPATKMAKKESLNAYSFRHLSLAGFTNDSFWGFGVPVPIPEWNTHFQLLDFMATQSGKTHYLLQSNRGYLFHGYHDTKEFDALVRAGGDGSEFAAVPKDSIPNGALFPAHEPWMTRFTGDADSDDVFMKTQAFLSHSDYTCDFHARATFQEVSRCEVIAARPHPNLARYLGVQTMDVAGEERVVRIAYQRYSMDLHRFVMLRRYLRPHHIGPIMTGLLKGMRHLHSIGLVHCDLRPMNVFVSIERERDRNGDVVLKEVVIGDFDASIPIGDTVSLKRASTDWWPEEAGDWGMEAEAWIDEWCLEKMWGWLKEGAGVWDFSAQREQC